MHEKSGQRKSWSGPKYKYDFISQSWKRSAIHHRNAKCSLFSSLNWIYFQQHTIIQFPNKKDHPLSKHHWQYSKNNRLHIHIYTFSTDKSCFFSDFLMLVLVVSSSLIQTLRTESVPHRKIKRNIYSCNFAIFKNVLPKSTNWKKLLTFILFCVYFFNLWEELESLVLCGRPLSSRSTVIFFTGSSYFDQWWETNVSGFFVSQ